MDNEGKLSPIITTGVTAAKLGIWGIVALVVILILFVLAPLVTIFRPSITYGLGAGLSTFAENDIPKEFIPIYQAAEAKYKVPWNVLAAIHRVETTFSPGGATPSPVGAIGPMQFMPATWAGWTWEHDAVGVITEDVDITDPKIITQGGGYGVDANSDGKADPTYLNDAVFATANFLSKHGATDGNIQDAILNYNHSEQYVTEVLNYADLYISNPNPISVWEGNGMFKGIVWPVPYTTNISSPFGNRTDPFTGVTSFHNGLDISSAGIGGQPAVAMAPGTIKLADWNGGFGNCVIIDHGQGLTSLYAHLKSISVQVGGTVSAGQTVGYIGTSGRSTGDHLHFGIYENGNPVDPFKYFK